MNKVFVDSKEKLDLAITAIYSCNILGVDTETNGLDPHTAKLWSIQVSTPGGNCYLFPVHLNSDYIEHLRYSFENEFIIKVFHNACFDWQILKAAGIDLKSAYCTLLGEKVLTCGLFAPSDLAHTLKRRFGASMSKEIRKDFFDGTFQADLDAGREAWTQARIDYSLGDIEYLIPLYKKQVALATEKNLINTLWLEQDLMPVTAFMEYRGVHLDLNKCKDFHERMIIRAAEYKESITKTLEEYWQQYWRPRFKKDTKIWLLWRQEYDEVLSTFKEREKFVNENGRTCSRHTQATKEAREACKARSPFAKAPEEKGPINLNSHGQVLSALAKAGIVLKNFQKATLEDALGQNVVLDELLDYKQYEKLKQFGSIHEKVNIATGRVHSEFNQIVDTGRYSSKKPNLQNIPARSDDGQEFRRLFCAEVGNKFIIADYSAIELVILAVASGDKNLLRANNRGYDLHCYTIALMLGVAYEDVIALKNGKLDKYKSAAIRSAFENQFTLPELEVIEDNSKWLSTLRKDYIKTMTYGVVYGLSPFGLARKFHCSPDDALTFIGGFFEAYPQVKVWLDEASAEGAAHGYSITLAGRKRFYSRPDKPSRTTVEKAVMGALEGEGRNMDTVDSAEWDTLIKEEWELQRKEYNQRTAAIRRKAANHPIQGTSADITKLAMVELEEAYRTNNFGANEGIVLTVHDEIISEISAERAEVAARLTKLAMEKAALDILGTSAKVDVEVKIVDVWDKN